MLTRHAAEQQASRFVQVEAIPEDIRWHVVESLARLPEDPFESKSQMIRFFLESAEFEGITNLSQDRIAAICRCSTSLVQRICAKRTSGTELRERGRPSLLSAENMASLENWVRERTESMDWITFREFKGRVVDLLEQQGVTEYPTTQFYRHLVDRLEGGIYTRSMATPLEEDRFNLSMGDIDRHFSVLQRLGIESMHPEIIINLDETGFGASRSHRLKGIQVITKKTDTRRPCVPIQGSRTYVSAIAAITASGHSLPPGLIVRRATVTEEFETIPIGRDIKIYATEKDFVTRNVFHNYIEEVVMPFIEKWRSDNNCRDARAALIVDGHGAHFGAELDAFCALHNTALVVLPPHSSHILQPLDRLYFSHVKQVYATTHVGQSLSELSRQILRVVTAFQASNIRYSICQSWRMTGITPVVEAREVTGVRLDPHALQGATALQHTFQGNPRARGPRNDTAKWGLLNEDQLMLYEAGQCPFCMAALPSDWEE